MDEYEIRQLINRILSGYIYIGKYILDTPSVEVLAEGDYIYHNCIYNNRFEHMLDDSQTMLLLIKNNMWSFYEEDLIKQLPKKIDNAKLNLYHNALVPTRQRRAREALNTLRQQYNTLVAKKTVFDQYTIQCMADNERERFIFSNIILNNKYKRITITPILLDKIIVRSKQIAISVKKYRELARSGQWQGIWAATGLSSFRKIDAEQRNLISYTSLYENIAKHPDSPSELVINDDDILDGWMIYIKDKQDREKREQDFDKSSKNMAKGNEHFIMTSSAPEDIQSVLDMNDTRGKVIQKKIHQMTKADGVANEYNIQEIRQDANIIQR